MLDSLPSVLLACRRSTDAKRIAIALATVSQRVWISLQDMPAGETVDVIVTDGALDESADDRAGFDNPRHGAAIGFGFEVNNGAAKRVFDAILPADFTDRELQLACSLAAALARLRRECDQLVQTTARVTQLAETDPLTGLANRRAWDARLPAMLARATQRGEPLWLALVDLDAFKAINEREGMSRGDEVLTATGQAVAAGLRREDLVARLGGDEFGVVLVGLDEIRIAEVLERLRRDTAAAGHVTASIGFTRAQPGATQQHLLTTAERALRTAKRAGGNRIKGSELFIKEQTTVDLPAPDSTTQSDSPT